MATFKAHYAPGEAVLHLDNGGWISSPYRMFRAGLLSGGVSVALYAARTLVTAWHTDHYLKVLQTFLISCQRKWEFQASIADRFTGPNAGRLLN